MENQCCKICGGNSQRIIGKPRINKHFPLNDQDNYKIVKCNTCSFYFTDPFFELEQQQWQKLYESDYFGEAHITGWQENLRQRERKLRLDLIENKLKINKGKFLDLGCGEGYVMKDAQKQGFEVYGIDIANNLAEENKNFDFIKGNIFEAKFPKEHFSVIYMDSVLEHVPDPMSLLKEVYRILSPGGLIFMVVPNEGSLMNDFAKLTYQFAFQPQKYGKIKPFVSPYHIQGFNQKSLNTALQLSNFKDISTKSFGGNYPIWKAARFGSKNYFISLFTYPVGLLSIALNSQVQLMATAVKH